MQGAPKQQVNAEEMLAELKRALESSTPAPNAPSPSASTAAKSSSPSRRNQRSHWGIDPPANASADSSIGQPTDLQKFTRPNSRRQKLRRGGLALGGVAAFFAGVVLMNEVLNRPAHEFSVGATEGLVRPQNEQTPEPSNSPRLPTEDRRQAAPLQAGALEMRPDASPAPANNGSVSAQGKARVDAPNLASSGLEKAEPAPAPLNSAAVLVPALRIGPDGAPIATAQSTPASTDSAQPPAQKPKPATAPVAPQMVKPDGTPIATAPPAPGSTDLAHPAETPNPAAAAAASQMVKPDAAPIATAPSTPTSTDSAPLTETPKPKATPIAHASNEPARPSTPKIDSRKKPLEKASLQKPLVSPKPPVRPSAQAERRSTEPAQPKQAEGAPQAPQGAGNPAQVAPVAAPSVQQRVADGMTHAFGYLIHLPGALVPHFGGPNPNPQ
jgi:hypothetical protein